MSMVEPSEPCTAFVCCCDDAKDGIDCKWGAQKWNRGERPKEPSAKNKKGHCRRETSNDKTTTMINDCVQDDAMVNYSRETA
eukprot:scaffold162_cov176-Amphora_coffeaeformis.AAC.38